MSQKPPSDATVHAKYDWLAAHNEMVVMYRQESDRAAALLAASFLESKLKARFRDYLVPGKVSTSLFNPYHPLSSFAGFLDVAYALGLLTETMYSDLSLIRKVRNHFAHHPEHTTFTQDPVLSWCKDLSVAKGIPTQSGENFQQHEPRDQFLFSATFALVYFDRFVGAATQRAVPEYPLIR